MANSVEIRGYAIPFLQAARCNGQIEFVDPRAFNSMLQRHHDTFLNFHSHDAEPLCRGVTLFADDYGLGFSANLPSATWDAIRWFVTGTCEYASVSLVVEQTERDYLPDGKPAGRIVKATIEHVTITDRPVYAGTGVWPAVVVGAMPPRLARLAQSWERGFASWNSTQRFIQQLRADKRNRLAAEARTRKAPRSTRLAARLGYYDQFRTKLAEAFASGQRIPILGHAALSRAGGFDRMKFQDLVMQAYGRRR